MAQTVKDKIIVEALSKYGVKVGNEYVNFSKNLNESEKGKLVPGGTYEVELYVADSGKRYINKVIASLNPPTASQAATKTEAPKAEPKKAAPPALKATETMTKADWNAKDRSQLIGGLSHDAATLVAAAISVWGDMDDVAAVIAAHKDVLAGLLKNRDEIK